ATIARYSMWKDAETHETVRVIGSEMLERNGNRTDCWKIDCGPFAIPGYRAYRWVEKESGIILQGALLGKKDEPEYWSFSTIR
ncbi:MAG: hypothetical protein OEV30_07270, partial [Ignavibacteria bacterium]|nr:hypothetical protein [Ignavibacteria bacterium]